MSVIYLKHPKSGTKVACGEAEAKYDEGLGWTRYNPTAEAPKANESAADPLTLDELREMYEAKFGKKPHHKKTAESLAAELDA